MKGYVYLLSTPLIAMGVVDTSSSLNTDQVFRARRDSQASAQPQPGHLQILQTQETFAAVSVVTPGKTSPRVFSKADPGRSHAVADVALPVSSTTDLSLAGGTKANTSTSIGRGSTEMALPAPINDEYASSRAFAADIIATGTSTKFTQSAATSMATVPQAEQISVSILATDEAVGSLPSSMIRVTEGTTARVGAANVAGTALKAANLDIGNGQSVMGKPSPVELIKMTYGTSARNAHKVYFPKQFERSAGALDTGGGMEAGSVKPDQEALTMKGGYYHFEDTSNGEGTNSNQPNGSDVALTGNRSDQPESSLNEKAESLSEQADAVVEIVSLNQSLEIGNVY